VKFSPTTAGSALTHLCTCSFTQSDRGDILDGDLFNVFANFTAFEEGNIKQSKYYLHMDSFKFSKI
jgi:hypothetical protein